RRYSLRDRPRRSASASIRRRSSWFTPRMRTSLMGHHLRYLMISRAIGTSTQQQVRPPAAAKLAWLQLGAAVDRHTDFGSSGSCAPPGPSVVLVRELRRMRLRPWHRRSVGMVDQVQAIPRDTVGAPLPQGVQGGVERDSVLG